MHSNFLPLEIMFSSSESVHCVSEWCRSLTWILLRSKSIQVKKANCQVVSIRWDFEYGLSMELELDSIPRQGLAESSGNYSGNWCVGQIRCRGGAWFSAKWWLIPNTPSNGGYLVSSTIWISDQYFSRRPRVSLQSLEVALCCSH